VSAISKVLRSVEGGGLMFWCPGCDGAHCVHVGEGPGPRWGYNEIPDRPTFTPSILVRGVKPMTAEQHQAWMAGGPLPEPIPMVCHSFVTDGNILFLGDCTHALAGKTVPIPDFEAAE
jgi:hypothetical protein